MHCDRDIGKKKTASAEEKLTEINPYITIRVIDTTIDETNIGRLVGRADGIVDAMDNFPTRYLLNGTAVKKKIPCSMVRYSGYTGRRRRLPRGQTPCLACIFPNAPPKEVFPLVGVTPGLIGMVQATEVVTYLINDGRLLTNRLFIWDGLEAHAEEIIVDRNPACPVCGDGRTKTSTGRK